MANPNSKINPTTNPEPENVEGNAARRAELNAKAVVATTNAGDFDFREADHLRVNL